MATEEVRKLQEQIRTLEEQVQRLDQLIQFTLRLEQPLRGVATNVNAILAVLDELRKASGASGPPPTAIPAPHADVLVAALAVNGGRTGRASILQTLQSWYGNRVDWLSDTIRYAVKTHLINAEGEDVYGIANHYAALKRLAQSPARTFLEDKAKQGEFSNFIEQLFIEFAREHKAFHVRRDFLDSARLDFGMLQKQVELAVPEVLVKLEKAGVIKTETGHDGIQAGKELPIAYVTYVGGA
jgi:hypothetical protein